MLTGIILAGGKSRRMGTDKALVAFRGKPMIHHIVENLFPLCDEIMISSNSKPDYYPGIPTIRDLYPSEGPLTGIVSGLSASHNERNLVISCDLPLASTAFLKILIKNSPGYEITVIRHRDRLQPLCGIYTKNILPELKKSYLRGERKLQDIIPLFHLNILLPKDFENFPLEEYLQNFNTREQLEK